MEQQAPSAAQGLLGTLPAVAAVLGAFIAAGNAGSEAIAGYYRKEAEAAKAKQELRLARIQADSTLAEKFLTMILDEKVSDADRLMLLGALTTIKGHPLREWAAQRSELLTKQLDALARARGAQIAAISEKDEGLRDVRQLESDIEQLNIQLGMQRDDVGKGQELQNQLVVKVKELALLKGKVSSLQVRIASVGSVGESASPTVPTITVKSVQVNLDDTLTVEVLQTAFPVAPRANIEQNAPLVVSAIKEFKISNPKLIATVFATIRAEVGGFEPWSEGKSRFNTATEPFDLYEPATTLGRSLGNTEPGDGEKYKGRGYTQLTGRANYLRTSQRLGLGSLLVDHPELASDPAVSARILCASVVGNPDLEKALQADDLKQARRRVNGGSHGLEAFLDAYNAIIARL